ncbi:MAG: tRNA (adenosine(37)-N6)-threonylcarbamoyltransferase complex ATPase subunit type 1 TsaE [Candidatus Aminicenantes bacterium]|nr:tRNA (adenosine(37)-N6)-threonylcarbamoyltransferase complex ATPase subunit type 1 TsaE [Candidatus Aminicenantes bacterium]
MTTMKKPPARTPRAKSAPAQSARRKKQAAANVFRSKSEKETREFAARLAGTFKGNEVVFLVGELGAGKTVFAKGVAAGLGLEDIGEVCSPTFTLMNVYQARFPIYHLDLYRLGSAPEIRDLGFEDYVGDGVILVEWAEKIDFPMPAIRVSIKVEPDETRTIRADKRALRP